MTDNMVLAAERNKAMVMAPQGEKTVSRVPVNLLMMQLLLITNIFCPRVILMRL